MREKITNDGRSCIVVVLHTKNDLTSLSRPQFSYRAKMHPAEDPQLSATRLKDTNKDTFLDAKEKKKEVPPPPVCIFRETGAWITASHAPSPLRS